MADDFEMDDEQVFTDPTPNFDATLVQGVADKRLVISKTLIGYPEIVPSDFNYPVELTKNTVKSLFPNMEPAPKRIFAAMVGSNEHNTKFVVHTPFGYIGWLERTDFTYSNYIQGNTTLH